MLPWDMKTGEVDVAQNPPAPWRTIVASALDWEQAHATFDAAVAKLPKEMRGQRPPQLPYSPWELVEHIRRTQADLVDFMTNAKYSAPEWPKDYWPGEAEPPSDEAWDESISAIRHDLARLKEFAERADLDLTTRIPWGEGQTYLRTILVAVDHAAYHVGELIVVRRLLGAWPA
jgi:hypothetical protein